MNENHKLHLDQQLCFTIYALSREITKLYRPHLEKLHMTYPQYLVMLVLWEHRMISMKQLGAKLHLDSGTLTPMLKRMEALGFIERKRDKEDERVVIVTLTKEGAKLQEQAVCIPDLLLEKVDGKAEQFTELLPTLQHLLQTVYEKNNED